MDNFYFTAPLEGMWDEMQPNLKEHSIHAERQGDSATFTGAFDDLDCFVSKHYDGSGHLIELKQAKALPHVE